MAYGGHYAYVSEHGSRRVCVLRMDAESGALTKIQEVAVDGKVMPLAVSPDRRHLYAGIRSEPYSIACFAIDGASGRLTLIGYAAAADSSVYIATDATGRFLLSALNPPERTRRTGMISVAAIGTQGFVQPPHQVIRIPPKAHAILPDPANRYVLASSCDGDVMVRHAFDASTGEFDAEGLPHVIVRRQSGPRHFTFHPNNRFMYLLNEYDGSVCVFRYDVRNGALSEIQIADAVPPTYTDHERGARAADIHFTPDGRWLYASVRNAESIAAFGVDPTTGRLVNAGHYPTLKEPRSFAIDPHGRFLVATGMHSNALASYRIDAGSGALTRLTDTPTGDGPNWIEIVRLP